MLKASRTTASEHMELEGYEGHFEHWDGGYSVGSRGIRRTPTSRRSSSASPTIAASVRTGVT